MHDVEDRECEWVRSNACADGTCLEVMRNQTEILVRNSQNKHEVLRFTPSVWRDFLKGVKRGDFD